MKRSRSTRRRPVPRAWREEHHYLSISTHIGGGGWGGWARVYRSRGTCACGAKWPDSPNTNNLQADDVRDYWLDHVEDAYYSQAADVREATDAPLPRAPS